MVRVAVYVSKTEAVKAGFETFGTVVIDYPISESSESIREELVLHRASHESDFDLSYDQRKLGSQPIVQASVESVTELLLELMDLRLKAKIAGDAKKEETFQNTIQSTNLDFLIQKSACECIYDGETGERRDIYEVRRAWLYRQKSNLPTDFHTRPEWEAFLKRVDAEIKDRNDKLVADFNQTVLNIKDARAKTEKCAEKRAQFIKAWVIRNGSQGQMLRHNMGVLPQQEVVDEIRDCVFAAIDSEDFPKFRRLTTRDLPCDASCSADDRDEYVRFSDAAASEVTREEFEKFENIRDTMLEGMGHFIQADCKIRLSQFDAPILDLREHSAFCECCGAVVRRNSVLITVNIADGALTLSREYSLS